MNLSLKPTSSDIACQMWSRLRQLMLRRGLCAPPYRPRAALWPNCLSGLALRVRVLVVGHSRIVLRTFRPNIKKETGGRTCRYRHGSSLDSSSASSDTEGVPGALRLSRRIKKSSCSCVHAKQEGTGEYVRTAAAKLIQDSAATPVDQRQRYAFNGELHARPPEVIDIPEQASYLALPFTNQRRKGSLK